MPTRLDIVWGGDVPGLSDHRLSLGYFGTALSRFLAALRRTASEMVNESLSDEDKEYRGRFKRQAEAIDIEIFGIKGHSPFELQAEIVSRDIDYAERRLFDFDELADRAADHLLGAIEQESQGNLVSSPARAFLADLPSGLTLQRYTLHKQSGPPSKVVEISTVKLTELPEDLPSLYELVGTVIGVGWEPGRTHVRLKPHEHRQINADATAEQVNDALSLRGKEVHAVVVSRHTPSGIKSRLVGLRRSDDPGVEITDEVREEYTFKRWDELLSRLAK